MVKPHQSDVAPLVGRVSWEFESLSCYQTINNTIMNKLQEIQHRLKAPKGQYNSFGKYKYRSCEDILEAVKPILNEVGCTLTLSDEIVLIGERYYVKATARLKGQDVDEATVAYAREDSDKKGMDGSQITGTASSYARKYALNGLFCIDDTKDADTDEYANQNKAKSASTTSSTEQKKEKPVLDSNHPHWQKILDRMAEGKGSIAKLQETYIVPAHAEKAITDYLSKHIKQS